MKLKRLFASFALVSLLFSVSLVPCWGNTTASSSSEYAMMIYPYPPTAYGIYSSDPIYVPSADSGLLYSATASGSISNFPVYFTMPSYEPVSYDRTVYFTIGIATTGTVICSGDATYKDVEYILQGINSPFTLEDGVMYGGSSNLYNNAHEWHYLAKLTVPANSMSMRFNSEDWFHFSLSPSSSTEYQWAFVSQGAFVLGSADSEVLAILELILDTAGGIEEKTLKMVSALNMILDNLRDLNADTDTIISLLEGLTDLSDSQLQQLELISSNVDAIYYFLTEEMKDEADQASAAVQETAQDIDNSHASEAYWQTSMQGNYDSLDLDGFSFGGITGGIELVGNIFTDMWSAFGEYTIIFTFPLVLGIALLVIGRISKSSGRKSSGGKGGGDSA